MRILLLFYFLISSAYSFAQTNEGTNLWFGFMEHRDVGENTMVAMITSKFNTNGIIQMPKMGWSQTFAVAANKVTIIELPSNAETIGSERISNTGVQINANQPIAAYIHQYHSFRAEATVVLPTQSLGNEYYTMSYNGIEWQGAVYPSEFLIVATEDDTEIFITLADNTIGGKIKGTTFSVQLNAGETYQVQAKWGISDLTGTHLIGDKKFALFSGNSWTEVPLGCGLRDNLLEQMYPVSTWGKQFVSVPNAAVRYDAFRILASKNGTQITVEGENTKNYTLDAGKFIEYNAYEAKYIQSSDPILVTQFNTGSSCSGHNLGDPAMVLLNSIEQTVDTVTLYNSSFENISENYINIILKTEDQDNIIFDGQPLAEVTDDIASVQNSQFSYARLKVNAGSHTIISEGCGIIATAYGYGDVESYAYSGGARFSPINANPIVEGGCLNDTIFFDTGLSPDRYRFEWDFGDGTTSVEAIATHFYDELGSYSVNLVVHDECLQLSDTFQKDIQITLRQAVDALDRIQVCEGETIELTATDVEEARYVWKGPNGYFSASHFSVINSSIPSMSGDYSVVGIVSGCATFPAITAVHITPTPQPDLGLDTLICTRGDSLSIIIDPGKFDQYLWQDGSTNANFEIYKEGNYQVEVMDEFGCFGIDEINFQLQCPTAIFAPNVFSPNGDEENDTFTIFGDQVTKAHLLILDRWGNLLFESHDLSMEWDGFINGKKAVEGVYIWTLEYEGFRVDGSVFGDRTSGTVTLLR